MPRPRRDNQRPSEPVVHSGVLFKRGYGRLLGHKTWKPRHFVLTRSTLQYYKFANGPLRGTIDLHNCRLEIMPMDLQTRSRRSCASIWRLALDVPHGRRLVMAAPTEFEMNAWSKQLHTALRALAEQQEQELEPQLHEETKEDEEVIPDPLAEAFERPATAGWKPATTDFQNFVAQPRRSVMFRRQSFDGLPIVPGVYYRHSTGQIDSNELQKELDELRADLANEDGHGDEIDDEMEEEALLDALRAFSRARMESRHLDTEMNTDPTSADAENDPQEECTSAPTPFGPFKPILYYKREESPVECTQDSPADDTTRWFSRVSRKFHRIKRSVVMDDPAEVEDSASDLPPHFQLDPSVSKPRRFSTGSMFLASERSVCLRDAEEAQTTPNEGFTNADKHSEKRRSDSEAAVTRPSSLDTDSDPTSSSARQSADVGEHSIDDLNEAWYSSFKTKWRARRGQKKIRKRDAESLSATPARLEDESPVPSTQEQADTDDSAVGAAVASILYDLVSTVEAMETSPCSVALDESCPTPIVLSPQLFPSPLVHEPPRPSHAKKRNPFRRWLDKLRRKRETRSRRHSTGDMLPECAVSTPAANAPREDPQNPSREDDVQRFSATLTSKPSGLIELQAADRIRRSESDLVDDSNEQVVVVVVRRRHSLGTAEDATFERPKRIMYRVYVDIEDGDDCGGSEFSSIDAPQWSSTVDQPPRVCAA